MILAVIATITHALLPTSAVSSSAFLALAVAAMVGILAGQRRHRPHRRLREHLSCPGPWEMIGLGIGMQALGRILGDSAVLASALGLGSITATGWGLVVMTRARFGDRARDHLAEATITATTVSMLVWVSVIEPVLRMNDHDLSYGPAGIVDITAAVLLACVAVHLLLSFETKPLAFVALVCGQTIPVVGGIVSFVGDFGGRPVLGELTIAIAALSVMSVGLAALESSTSAYESPAGPAGARLDRLRLANLVVPVVIGPVLLTLVLTGVVVLSPTAMATFTIVSSLMVVGHLIAMVQARASSTHWASHDKLTGLPNRALFRERAARSLDRSRSADSDVAIIYLDLDRFKHINDSLGHEAGDQLLEQVARRILSCVDPEDTVARLGGDEFAILLTDIAGPDVPAMLARRLLKQFSTPFNLKPRPVFMSPSLGIAVSEPGVSLGTLLTQADTAMYRAKESGRNNFAIWSQEMNEASKQRLMLETHLHTALSNNEMHLVYQPKVNLQTQRVVGVEALLRWNHPTLGPISPAVFIHLAEESGLINQIGEWVLEQACRQARTWYENGFTELTMAVNLSTRQFQHRNIADLVSRNLRTTELPAQLLELELTESIAMSGEESTLGVINDIRAMGVRCTIDDFGTGYSNLSYLSRLPIDALKIDKAFVSQIDKSGGDANIVVAIIAMAHGLGLKVVAEGVETPKQAEFLVDQRCDEMQGYLFSKPVPPAEIESLLMLENFASGPGRLGIDSDPRGRRIERSMPSRERIDVAADEAFSGDQWLAGSWPTADTGDDKSWP